MAQLKDLIVTGPARIVGDLHLNGTINGFTLGCSVPSNAVFTDTNTWRTVQCNGTTIGSNTLNLKAGDNVTLSNSNGTITISAVDNNSWRGITDSVSTTDSTISGSATAVKTAYDKAVDAYNLADGKTSNTGTVTSVATGAGLTGGTITTTGTIKCNLNSETSLGTIGSTSKLYAVGVDSNGKLCVNVPWSTDTNIIPVGYCTTVGGNAAKIAVFDGFKLTANRYFMITFVNQNTRAGALTLNINGTGAKSICINGAASSASNYTLPAGPYIAYYNGTNYYINTDGTIPNIPTLELLSSTLSDYALSTDAKKVKCTLQTATKAPLLACATTSPTSGNSYEAYYDTGVYLCAVAGGLEAGTIYASAGFFQESYTSSDENLKNFGDDIKVDLDKLSSLKKKYFTWKSDEDGKPCIGVSAQEIQELYPELVTVNEETGNLAVSYEKLSVIALKAIDELHAKNKELEDRLERLEKLIMEK